jgi:hypothetical protein
MRVSPRSIPPITSFICDSQPQDRPAEISSNNLDRQGSETVRSDLHVVASGDSGDTRRGSRQDDVAACELEILEKLRNHLRYLPYHLIDVDLLPHLAIDGQGDHPLINMASLARRMDGADRG